jgi:hypothetical protein
MATPVCSLLLALWMMSLLLGPGVSSASGPGDVVPVKPELRQKEASLKPVVKAESVAINNLVINPGLESGKQDWTTFDSRGQEVIRQVASAHGGTYLMALGGVDSDTSYAYQDVAIPADASQVVLQFWYFIDTQEMQIETRPFDTFSVALKDPANDGVLANLVTLTNANRTNGAWAESAAFDVSGFRGKTVRLAFSSLTDASKPTTFFLDDIQLGPVLNAPPAPTAPLTSFQTAPVAGSPFTVRFTDQSQGANSWLWDFGDGATSTEQNPVHSYGSRGTYTVTLTATNSVGSSSVSRRVNDFPDISSIIMSFTD